ncbi:MULTISPECIES: hypothetical protein [unclassified Rhizobium]|uniref:hypothetical protein n=1 Tax=unclassified Rhizobium TaxID=2613769 RepID=UPI0012E3CF74|nr:MULTISPECIES: hypothetical protein [unclassified Rhizobium]
MNHLLRLSRQPPEMTLDFVPAGARRTKLNQTLKTAVLFKKNRRFSAFSQNHDFDTIIAPARRNSVFVQPISGPLLKQR